MTTLSSKREVEKSDLDLYMSLFRLYPNKHVLKDRTKPQMANEGKSVLHYYNGNGMFEYFTTTH